jgi:hypothetical protein
MPNPSGYPVEMAAIYPAIWASPSTSYDARAYSDVEMQLVGTFTAYTPQRSLDGTNYVACNAYDKDGNALSSITTAGIYRLPGNGYLKLNSGSGATVTIRVGG